MPQIHPRVTEETQTYLLDLATRGDTSVGRVLDLIVVRAQRLGWDITPGVPGLTSRSGNSELDTDVPTEPRRATPVATDRNVPRQQDSGISLPVVPDDAIR